MYWVIERTYFPEETLGVLTVVSPEKTWQCKTLELPDLGNEPWVSCIKEGVYTVKKVASSNKFKYPHFKILNVPRRTDIKVHIANFVDDISGCVAVGEKFIDINNDGLTDVTNSRKTLKKLNTLCDDEFLLWIKS